MKIIVAPQAFKGSLTAFEIAQAMQDGIVRVFPEAVVDKVPVADGGDGTLDILAKKYRRLQVQGAVEPVQTSWGIVPDGSTAVIELAKICGLAIVPPDQRNPLLTTTYGIGEVITAALDEGIRRFVIGIGGSSTNDAACGMAQALGIKLLDAEGHDIPFGGGALSNLDSIDLSGLDPRMKESTFIVGCDVTNPLVGPQGASRVYSPQKGATPEMTRELENALQHFALVVARDLGVDLRDIPGGGAAGGAGAGMLTFLGAELKLGIEMILEQVNFDRHLEGADLVITGEGCLESQTLYHKAPIGVAKSAKRQNIPVLAIVGTVKGGYQQVHQHGIDAVIPLSFIPTDQIPGNTAKLISRSTEQAMRLIKISGIITGV